jgi:hypothetical protein
MATLFKKYKTIFQGESFLGCDKLTCISHLRPPIKFIQNLLIGGLAFTYLAFPVDSFGAGGRGGQDGGLGGADSLIGTGGSGGDGSNGSSSA